MIIKVLGTGAETSKPTKPWLGKYHPSCLITNSQGSILIDVGDDVLEKCSKDDLLDVNTVLITHGHRDAISGIPVFNKFLEEHDKIVNVYANQQTIDIIKLRYSQRSLDNYNFYSVKAKDTLRLNGLIVKPVKVFHDKDYPTFAYNFDKVFFYGSDMGPIWDEYQTNWFKDCVLMIIDGAYWDHQIPLNNHIAVLKNLDYILSLNNKYTLFIGMGNQWPRLDEADKILKDKLEEYKKDHPNCKVKELRVAREREKFMIDLNKVYQNELVLKPGLDEVLQHPYILQKISKKELLMYHLRLHQWWAVKKSDKVLKAHVLTVKEFFKRGLNHRVVSDLDRKTYRILGREIKIFDIWSELKDEITIKSNIIQFVGSSLSTDTPNDLDVIAPHAIEKVIHKFLEKYNPHYLGPIYSHGDVVNVYDLVLKKKESISIVNRFLPDFTKTYSLSKKVPKLSLKSDLYVVEPMIKGKAEIVVDKKSRVIYERVVIDKGKEIITDVLAYRSSNLLNEILLNRMYFAHKKWLSKIEPKLIPIRWVVKKECLFDFIKTVLKRYNKLIIRPANSKYYDGKFIIAKETLKPFKKFPPLKATGSAYHEMEYFNPKDAWDYFCKYYVETEGRVRAEYKIDGWRSIWEQTKDKTLVYFEDSKINESKKFPSLCNELSTFHTDGIILDGELMEWDPDRKEWKSRHELMKWSQAKHPTSDENVRVFVFDILYLNGQDLHKLPLSKRYEILKELSKKFKKHFILCPGKFITTEKELYKLFNFLKHSIGDYYLGAKHGIDGLMLKALSGNYPLNGRTTTWAKDKFAFECNAIVLEVHKTKGHSYNYTVGYKIPQDKKDKFTPIQKIGNKYYGVLGTTFNTKIKATVGQILNIAATEYKKTTVDNKIKYTLFQARVLFLKPTTSEPDDYLVIDRLSTSSSKSFTNFFISKASSDTGQWTIKEGDTGKYGIQCHSRGIRPLFITTNSLTYVDFKKYGLNKDYFIPSESDLKEIVSLYDKISIKDWKDAIKQAQNTTGTKLTKLMNKFLKNVDFPKINKKLRNTIARLDVVSIHQDLRLVPSKASYFEGGHWTTPGNQFKENRLLSIDKHIYLQFMLKVPHVDEPTHTKEPVIRGPALWINIGHPSPFLVAPNSIGSTPYEYAVFWRHDYGTWYAGRQTSPHGRHFKLFKFKGNKLNGWIIFMWAPIGNKRVWLCYKPKNQEKYENHKTRNKEFEKDVESIYKSIYKYIFNVVK